MASENVNPGYPAIPSSLNGAYEMNDYSGDRNQASLPFSRAGGPSPYLSLADRLSQTWINRWTILLLLILARVLLAVKNLNSDIASAQKEALAACSGVEAMGSALASMPYYMSMGVNELAADGVTKAVNGLMEMLQLTVTGVEEIVLFVINMMTSTYVCLITLAITGATEAAISVIENVGNFMNKTIGGLTSDITGDVSSFEGDLNSFISDLNSIPAVFGSSAKIPTLNINSSIAALNSIQIDPTQLDDDLNKLNSSLPTFSQVQNFTNTVISLPFEEVKKLINQSMVAYQFDASIFPVAQRESLTFCSNNNGIADFFAGLTKVADDARKIFIAVAIILAILACLPMGYLEVRRWRSMRQRASLVQNQAWDQMDVINIASRPYTASAGIWLSSKVHGQRKQNAVRWFVAYCTSLPALFLLALGVAGLLACLCQVIILKSIEREVPILANEVGDFAGTVVSALNNASQKWSDQANSVILDTNTKINNDMFGWVNTTTHAINDTLNTFVGDMTTALNDTFGGTILYQPILGIFECLVGLKVASFEKGLTWVSDNAKVDFPVFPNNTFSLGAAASLANDSTVSSFLSSPGSASTDDITAAIDDLTGALASAIREEAIISTVIVCLYLVIVLIGLGKCLYTMMGRDKLRGEGGPTAGIRTPVSPRFNGRAEPMTLPKFGPHSAQEKSYDDSEAFGPVPQYDEKFGHAGHRSVQENLRPGHNRVSSYGDIKR